VPQSAAIIPKTVGSSVAGKEFPHPRRKWESACNSVDHHRRQDRTPVLSTDTVIYCAVYTATILRRHPMLSYHLVCNVGPNGHGNRSLPIPKLKNCEPTTNQLRNTCQNSPESLRTVLGPPAFQAHVSAFFRSQSVHGRTVKCIYSPLQHTDELEMRSRVQEMSVGHLMNWCLIGCSDLKLFSRAK
jgi:hypothetical protein